MADAVQPIRLVPRLQSPAKQSRTFACNGADELRRVLASLAASGGPVFSFAGLKDLEETWLDTSDRRLLRAGLILRARVDAGAATAHLTPFSGPWPTERSPAEIVQPMTQGPLEERVRDLGPVGTRVRDLVGVRPLERYVELAIRQNLFEGTIEASRVEMCVEEVRAIRPARLGPAATSRLTITGDTASVRIDALVDALRAPCELAAAPSLAETARELTGVEPPPEPDLGPEDTDPGMSASALAFVSLRRHARAYLRNEAGTRLGDDTEALHDMRVAGRRMRAAFSLFAAFIPKRGESLRRELSRVGSILGAVRDLDVQLEQLAARRAEDRPSEAVAFDAIETVLKRRRGRARRRLIATFETARYVRFTERLCAFLRHGPGRLPAPGLRPARNQAEELIGRRYRAVRKVGDRLTRESPASDFHALRIRAKRLRYALEFHRPLYDGDVAAMIESLTALQDLLGEHQDAFVAIGHLEELATIGSRKLPPRAAFLMGTIAAKYAHRAEGLRRAFPKTYRKIRGRRWKALKSSLAGGVA